MTQKIIIDSNEIEVESVIYVDSNRNGISIDQLSDGTYLLTKYGEFSTASEIKLP